MFKITLIASGNKMPEWIVIGVKEFEKRLSEYSLIKIIEIPLLKRNKKSALTKILSKEAEAISALIPKNTFLIALSSNGLQFSSETLATKLTNINAVNNHLCLLIGGPEGLHPSLLNKSKEIWSLSKLTLPHPLVRIIILEGLYRAFSILAHHPYHK